MINPNDPAFPVEYENGMAEIKTLGLTKRAMQGAIASGIHMTKTIIGPAVVFADLLIAELNKEVKS